MKKIIPLIFILAALFLIPSYSYPSSLGGVHLSLIDGDVQIYTEDNAEWVAADINMPLRDGDRIWVPGEGRAELQLNDGSSLRLTEDSSLDILRTEGRSFQFFLNSGHAYVNFRGLKGTLLQLDTPVSSTRAYERGIYRVDVPDDRYTDISVDRGVVYAESRNGSTRVREGYTLSLRGDDYADLHPLEPSNGWEDWNEERDRTLYERQYSTRYLPDELSPYSYDFDRYGRWVYARDYGYVWTPSVVVSAGWSPYRLGRWAWIGGDYVWVSYEPWGWVPYHYGRWIFNVSIGWCWVPPIRGAVYWGPGFVGWVYTPEYVAWVPLAPGETYYGYGYYGPHSVNITNVSINNIYVKKVYKNVYVNNAVTVVHKETFVKGKPEPMQMKDNPFLKQRISIGRPGLKPVRETTQPGMRQIYGMKQPSSKIKDIKVEELKKERPLVKPKTRSVMRPGASVKEMPLKPGKVGAPGERKIEKPEKQEVPMEKKKALPEQRSSKPSPSQKETAPAKRKVEKPSPKLEQKEPGAPPKKETEKPPKKKVPEEKEKVSPEQKNPEQREMENPGDRRTQIYDKLQSERKMRIPNERQLMVKKERTQRPTEKQVKTERQMESRVRSSDPKNKKPESYDQVKRHQEGQQLF
ncbi:MAG TPA: DUF6600 domain-containing protein [Thermodesulfovibrionales bacterium]|nr:DUF6600 domain-containing protein [Thermodesulfovibrionales bacterium]